MDSSRNGVNPIAWVFAGVVLTALVFLVAVPTVKSSAGSHGEGSNTSTIHKPSRFSSKSDHLTEIASVVGMPLHPIRQNRRSSQKDGLALYDRILRAEQLAQRGGKFGQIAHDYAVALRFAESRMQNSPNKGDFLQSGIDIWQGSRDDDSLQFFNGLWSAANEINEINQYTKELERAHAKIIDCRKQVIKELQSDQKAETSNQVAETYFQQSGFSTSLFPDDTLVLKNISHKQLHHVMVVTHLIGMNGETFDNLYYTDKWNPGESLKAICQSDRPFRETVRGVSRLRYQVFSDELTGKPQALVGNPILHMKPPG